MKKSLQILLAAALLLSGLAAHAAHEGGEVQPGPVTSLERLESLKTLATAHESRRAFTIQHWRTTNGARVYFVEARELPMLDLRLVFDAGGARDGDKPGLAAITSRMLEEGSASRDTAAVAKAFESVGADFDTGSYRDMATVELRVLSDPAYRDTALEVFTDVLAHPQFAEEPFARVMQGSLVALQQQEQSPASVASRLFYKNLYDDHPYAQPPGGTRESLPGITREDLRKFHQRYYVSRNLVIALVGSLSRVEAESVAEKVSMALPAGNKAAEQLKVKPLAKARSLHQSFASAQTHVLMGQTGIAYGEPDYYALAVGNEILGGGGFTSRLMKEIRQRRGFTYGVYSAFTQMRVPGPFMVNFSTRADQSAEALKVAQDILADFVRNGPDEQELKEAKANIAGGFPLATASNASIVSYLGAIGFYDMPLDFLDTYVARIQAVTAKEIKAAFKRHLQPERMLVVTVGQEKP